MTSRWEGWRVENDETKAFELYDAAQDMTIKSRIYVVRGQQVMLDRDLAELYGVENKRLNENVKRNANRFPEEFCFQLTAEEAEEIRSQIATLHPEHGEQHTWWRYLPRVFTEQGIAMLSAVLRSETAVAVWAKRKGDKLTDADIETFRAQYGSFELKHTEAFHDRYLILDGTTGYHIGASIKDAGKKCFGINWLEDSAAIEGVLARLGA